MSARCPTQLASLHHEILRQLGRVHFATGTQLAHWCRVRPATISRATAWLSNLGLVHACVLPRPAIWTLSGAGAAVCVRTAFVRRSRPSWSLMAHACHRNTLEIALDKQQGGFRFLSRAALLKQGFNPARGEHAGIDATEISWLALLDDYLMASARIARVWRRRHTPNPRHWPDATGRAWCDVMQRYVIGCTDPVRAARHRAWIVAHDIPAYVIDIPALWST